MREDFTSYDVTVEDQKNRAINTLREKFSGAMLRRFHAIKASIEDVWDLATNKAALVARLKALAVKDTYTAKNLVDIAIIACILWNDVDDEVVPE